MRASILIPTAVTHRGAPLIEQPAPAARVLAEGVMWLYNVSLIQLQPTKSPQMNPRRTTRGGNVRRVRGCQETLSILPL